MENQSVIWAEINLAHVAHNLREVKKIIPKETKVMAVVKANGYGHGAKQVARVAAQNGATHLAVARFEEAQELRAAGLDLPILIFGYVPPPLVPQALASKLTLTIFDPLQAKDYAKEAQKNDQVLSAHLKIDTGMGRLGLPVLPIPGDNQRHATARHTPKGHLPRGQEFDPNMLQQIAEIHNLPGIKLTGIYSHFAQADHKDKTHALGQLAAFSQLTQVLQNRGYTFPVCHLANSAGIIDLSQSHLDLVRPGIMLYGLYPSRDVDQNKVCLKPVMALKTRIAQVKEVAAGFKISYGSTFVTEKETKIATLALGYADGFPRILSSKGQVLIKGQLAPVIGRVCMDQTMVDVGHIAQVKAGDVALVFGEENGHRLPVEINADLAQTINYELVSALLPRVKRVYN